MFRNRDFSKWGYEDPAELQRRSEELLADKEKAFKFMLQNDTQELEFAREEFSYYTNQCLNEVRRVGKDNGQLLTGQLMEMSQVECAYINQHHVMWADFLCHFMTLANNEAEPKIIPAQ
eukprot:CAMPEP_0116878234 /NCGR_PEP_ID=MMETSP0463-20121206/9964_1 /TAXON_ID=181622 /ORGANISM="Strombidinopsis sp, Strain SopsisLIS2011" /LENGTH=118 /DNA_ID=CAMNT_0004526211 /DNA_START=1214 /DNA_END=1570 /DNA_ORIENTATION=-